MNHEYKTFNHVIIPLPAKLKAQTVDSKRYYETPEGNLYLSVTTTLSKLDEEGIKKWRESVGEDVAKSVSARATGIGTSMHKIIEDYLANRDISHHKKLLPVAHFHNLLPYINKIDNIMAQEATLWSDTLKLAGATDCIADFPDINGVMTKSIIDFKTSTKKKEESWILKYFYQACCYSEMFKERTGIEANQLVIMISGEDGSAEVYIKQKSDYLEELLKFLEEIRNVAV